MPYDRFVSEKYFNFTVRIGNNDINQDQHYTEILEGGRGAGHNRQFLQKYLAKIFGKCNYILILFEAPK